MKMNRPPPAFSPDQSNIHSVPALLSQNSTNLYIRGSALRPILSAVDPAPGRTGPDTTLQPAQYQREERS